MLFNVFIIDLEEWVDHKLVKAVEGTKLFHLVNTIESCREFRKDFSMKLKKLEMKTPC